MQKKSAKGKSFAIVKFSDLKSEFELAQSECALFEKDAVLTKTSFSECPLLTPKAIIFKCLSKQKK